MIDDLSYFKHNECEALKTLTQSTDRFRLNNKTPITIQSSGF